MNPNPFKRQGIKKLKELRPLIPESRRSTVYLLLYLCPCPEPSYISAIHGEARNQLIYIPAWSWWSGLDAARPVSRLLDVKEKRWPAVADSGQAGSFATLLRRSRANSIDPINRAFSKVVTPSSFRSGHNWNNDAESVPLPAGQKYGGPPARFSSSVRVER